MGQLIGIGFSSSMKMNFFAVLVFVGIVACVVCEEAKKEDVQEAAKDLKSDMKTKLKNLAMKSKRAKDYKRQDYYTGRTSRGSWALRNNAVPSSLRHNWSPMAPPHNWSPLVPYRPNWSPLAPPHNCFTRRI